MSKNVADDIDRHTLHNIMPVYTDLLFARRIKNRPIRQKLQNTQTINNHWLISEAEAKNAQIQ